jgi:hypothetical protein
MGFLITADDANGAAPFYASNISTLVFIVPAPATNLLVIVPGENFTPASGTGRAGSAANQTSGVPFTVTVRATDSNWNLQSSSNPFVNVGTSDTNDIEPAQKQLVNGENTFIINFIGKGMSSVWVADASLGLYGSTSTSVSVGDGVPPDAISNLVATRGQTHSTVQLTWTAPGDDGYNRRQI